MRFPCRQPAFSLVELIVVVAIVAILAGVAIPRFDSGSTRHRADAAARRVVSDLVLARRHANHVSTAQTVTFDPAADSYQLSGLPDLDRPSIDYVVHLADEPYGATLISADFNGSSSVNFNGFGQATGMASTTGTVVIQIGDQQRTIILDPDTGELTISELLVVHIDPI